MLLDIPYQSCLNSHLTSITYYSRLPDAVPSNSFLKSFQITRPKLCAMDYSPVLLFTLQTTDTSPYEDGGRHSMQSSTTALSEEPQMRRPRGVCFRPINLLTLPKRCSFSLPNELTLKEDYFFNPHSCKEFEEILTQAIAPLILHLSVPISAISGDFLDKFLIFFDSKFD